MPHRVCFVTGTRAEFGLMRSALAAIRANPKLKLQIVATGMHLDRLRGSTVDAIRPELDAIVPWRGSVAIATGRAVADLAAALDRLSSDIVLVVGDRVEAFAAATAGFLGGKAVAHVHGGDRAQGQVDDSLRHAITKLAHIHFPATRQSAVRLIKLGEQPWRIHRVGSPGIDGIGRAAAPWREVLKSFPGLVRRRFALAVLHPVSADETLEERHAQTLIAATRDAGVDQIVAIYPNNDPGAAGILRAWRHAPAIVRPNVPRELFLGLLRDAAVLVGNSSSGIIEAGSFATAVVDVGPRQLGRECRHDVRHVSYSHGAIHRAVAQIWNHGRPRRTRISNPYAAHGDAGRRIADILGRLVIDRKLLTKLIAY
jgi:UDP-hydrolysing UDP-N-acetyl-D-glucosamine 2-epimerase